MILQEGETSTTFHKTIFFQSNQRAINSRNVTINRKSNDFYAFNVTLNFQGPPQEIITFYTTWTVEYRVAGNYTINLFAFSDDPDVNPSFKSCQDLQEIQVVEDAPIINQPLISTIYHPQGLDPTEMYVYPEEDIEVRCNITCLVGIKNATIRYSADFSIVWEQIAMSKGKENEWIGTIPGQPEGKSIIFYLEAFSSTGKSSRSKEYALTVSDLQGLELRTKIATATTITIILVGCIAIFALKKRRVTETL